MGNAIGEQLGEAQASVVQHTRSVGSKVNLDRLLIETDITFWKGPFNLSRPRFNNNPNRIPGT